MKNDYILTKIPVNLAILGGVFFVFALIFFRSTDIYVGILLGFVLVIANFIFITKIVAKLFEGHYKSKPLLALMFFFKLVFMAGVVFLAFWVIKVNLIAFVLGYLSLMPVVLYQLKFRKAEFRKPLKSR